MRFFLVLPVMLLLAADVAFAQQVSVFTTTADLKLALHRQADLFFAPGQPDRAALIITVNDSRRFQTMDGFGGSLTDGSAWLLHDQLPADVAGGIMTALFDPRQGIGLSVLRQPIASTDLSRNHYTYDDLPAGQRDPLLKNFSTRHDDAYVFPVVREALKLNPSITVMAAPWSPPAWMKTKPTMYGGQLREGAMASYAAYLVRSVESFQQAGVPVKYLSVQNEPLNEPRNYPGTFMSADQEKRLIANYLGPDLQKAGLSTKILAYDHNWDHPEYPIEVLSDPQAAPFLAGTALHCYGGTPDAQETIHDAFPDKGIWMTECSGGSWQKENPLLSTAHLLIDVTRRWSKSVVLWTIVLDSNHDPHDGGCSQCRGLVTVDPRRTPVAVTYNGDFYALGHASKFVYSGATRIASTTFGRQSLESVAFQNPDGSIALLVLNNRAEKTDFSIRWSGRNLHATLLPGELATYAWAPAR